MQRISRRSRAALVFAAGTASVAWCGGSLLAQPSEPGPGPATAVTTPPPPPRAPLANFGTTGVAAVTRQGTPAEPATPPFRLTPALGLPDWLEVRGEQRTRYEMLDDQFRRGFDGSDQGLFLRTALRVTARPGVPQATLELMDSRQELADDGSPITSNDVNAAEPIQLFGALNLADAFAPGDKLFVQGGRFVLDIGSRRFVARNDFRNTTNTFTGFNGVWTAASGAQAQAFWTLPIERFPQDQESVLNNEVVWDDESLRTQFWGLVGTVPQAVGPVDVQAFVFGLHERDDGNRATRDRELYTVGGRVGPRPAAGRFDFEVEAAYQFGTSRASATAAADLDHSAYFVHAEVGHLFPGDARLRVAALFDYASGDDDPADADNNRFDTLFGARRFDFGPTGIFGAFARSNVVSPGYRVTFAPAKRWDVMFTHRFYWLADSSDAWTAAGLQDPTGESGSYLGTMPEARVRYEAIPGNLMLEAGAAYLFRGRFAEDAPGSPDEGDSLYVYVQSTLTF